MLNVNLDRLAEACGYDRILWDEANNCWSGFGSSDPADRSRDDAGGFLVASDDAELESLAEREGCMLTAGDFAEQIEFPVVFFAGVGSPAGEHVAILEETMLPFDLEELHGTISEDGVFEATDIDGETDCNGNTVYKVQVFSNERIWTEQNDDYMREGGEENSDEGNSVPNHIYDWLKNNSPGFIPRDVVSLTKLIQQQDWEGVTTSQIRSALESMK